MGVVLLVSYSAILGGAERVLVDFAGALDGEICLACPPGPLATAAAEAGIRPLALRQRPLHLRGGLRERTRAAARLAGHGREVRGLARDLDPDVLIVCGMRSALSTLLGPRLRPPIVFDHHDFVPGPVVGRLVAAAARRAAAVVAPSAAVAQELRTFDPRIEAQVVHPGVAVDSFPSHREPATPAEVLVLGALVDWKRPDLAIEVCSLVRQQGADVRVRFVGAPLPGDDGGLALQLRRRAADDDVAGAVDFVGSVEDPRPELARATLLLHCSPHEPFGLAVVEALAAGRPAVVPAAGGPAEIVDGRCGILYPPGDAGAAADGVLDLIAHPDRAREMGEHGRARAAARFNINGARETFANAVSPFLSRRRAAAEGGFALLTVTHNSAHEIGGLLASAQRHLPEVPVVVVDSASQDETLAVTAGFGQAVTIALRDNVGFGRACNRGLAEITAPVTVLVNPDVELVDDSLRTLAAEAGRGDRPPRLLAPLVLNADGTRQDTVHPVPASLSDALRIVLPPARVPGALGAALAPWRARAPRRVGWAVGCALAAPTPVLRALGPFDARIFMFGEDLDLCLHAAHRGVETWFWPTVRVVHHGRRSTTSAFGGEPFELLAQARRATIARRLGVRGRTRDDAIQALTFATRIVGKRALGRGAKREQRQLRALATARRDSM